MQLPGVKENTEAHVINIQYNSHYPQRFLVLFFFALFILHPHGILTVTFTLKACLKSSKDV